MHVEIASLKKWLKWLSVKYSYVIKPIGIATVNEIGTKPNR